MLVIGMKRGQGLPEWEEICAVAMSVQNMHLVMILFYFVGLVIYSCNLFNFVRLVSYIVHIHYI
jgi:hypothetical protein